MIYELHDMQLYHGPVTLTGYYVLPLLEKLKYLAILELLQLALSLNNGLQMKLGSTIFCLPHSVQMML